MTFAIAIHPLCASPLAATLEPIVPPPKKKLKPNGTPGHQIPPPQHAPFHKRWTVVGKVQFITRHGIVPDRQLVRAALWKGGGGGFLFCRAV